MKYTTKQERMIALTDAWQEVHGKVPFTTKEVAEWADERFLVPVPPTGVSVRWCEEWERLLEEAKKMPAITTPIYYSTSLAK